MSADAIVNKVQFHWHTHKHPSAMYPRHKPRTETRQATHSAPGHKKNSWERKKK